MRPILIATLFALALFALALSAPPSLARSVPFCPDPGHGLVVTLGFSIGEKMTEREENEFYLMALRQRGVDATGVNRWNGCLRAFVRSPGGGEHMEFFDPKTLERVD